MALRGVYTTPEQFKEYLLSLEDTKSTPKDDQRILQFCIQMSRKFEAACLLLSL